MPRQPAEMLDTRYEGHKHDQGQVASVRVRIRVRGSRSYVWVDGGTVARIVKLGHAFLVFPTTPPSLGGF